MTTRMLGALRQVLTGREADSRGDAELLQRFLAGGDEEAFAALVRRHGPMVLGVCRRLLGHAQDAEDAFQATFLVLARKARSIVRRERVGPWLYGVAVRTARKARGRAARYRTAESQVAAMKPESHDAEATVPDWQPLFDRELQALPEKYRLPIVLCELQGLTRREAARQLRLSEGTLSSRLARGRQLLRRRLGKLGFAEAATSLAAAVPIGLVSSTSRAAALVAAGKAAAGLVPAGVLSLTEGVLKSMVISQCKCGLAVLVLVGVLGGIGSQAIALMAGAAAAEPNTLQAGKQPASTSEPINDVALSPDEQALQGTWRLISARDNGRDDPRWKDEKTTLRFERGQLFAEGSVSERGKYRLIGTKAEPKRIDILLPAVADGEPVPESGTWAACIYQVEGDRLQICMRDEGRYPPPAQFRAEKGDRTRLLTLERLTPGKLEDTVQKKREDAKADDPALWGAWKVVSIYVEGPDWRLDARWDWAIPTTGEIYWRFEKGRVLQSWNSGLSAPIKGDYIVDMTASPRQIDLRSQLHQEASPGMPKPKGPYLGIYKVVEDQLTLRLGLQKRQPGPRPRVFSLQPGEEAYVVVLERQKPLPQPGMLDVEKATRPVAVVGDVAITRQELGEYLIERYGAEKLEQLVNKRIIDLACAKKRITVTPEEVEAAVDADLKEIKQTREEFMRQVLQHHGKTFFEWKEDVIKPRLLLQKLGQVSIRAADEDLRREFESRYGKKVRVRVLIWPKGTPEAQVKQEYEQLLQNVEKVKESARRTAWGSLEVNGDRLFDVPRYAWPEDSQGQRIADIAFRLKPGELSSLFPVGEETYALQCVGHVSPVEGKEFDKEKASLLKDTLEKKISAEVPKLFESLRREAKPELLLKKE
jgi:RNA polymerase sigma factor (sigma-70 family)